jgi:hypothetical protein
MQREEYKKEEQRTMIGAQNGVENIHAAYT